MGVYIDASMQDKSTVDDARVVKIRCSKILIFELHKFDVSRMVKNCLNESEIIREYICI